VLSFTPEPYHRQEKATSPRSDAGRSGALFVLTHSTNPLRSWLLREKPTQTFLLGKTPSHPPPFRPGDGTSPFPF